MEFKQLIKQVQIPALGLGTWGMGGWLTSDSREDTKFIKAIGYAIDQGMTHIDTAELYGRGHAEELVGEVIKDRDRKQLFITTKVLPTKIRQKQIWQALNRSLERLGTDYVDLYLIHHPSPWPGWIDRAIHVLDEAVSEGKARFMGVSNFSLSQLKRAQAAARHPLVTDQVEYSLWNQPEQELLDYCRKSGIVITAYSPLVRGELAFSPGDKLMRMAEKYGRTPVQAALRWLLDQENVVVIPKASTKEHINEILGSLGWRLKEEDFEELKSGGEH